MCCSCGVDADTQAECRSSATEVTLRDGTQALGYCGISCDGSAADTVGLIEFDTKGLSVVGTHYWPEVGSGNAMASPNADLIVIEPRYTSVVKILAVGENGVLSSDANAADIETGFTPRAHRDTLFIQEGGYDHILLGSIDENYIVIAELDDVREAGVAETVFVTLTNAEESTASGGRLASRAMAWAPGTSYVMVSGSGADEIYVVDLGKGTNARVVRVVEGVQHRVLIHVKIEDSTTSSHGKDGDDGKDSKNVYGLIALIIAIVALVVLIALTIYVCKTTREYTKLAKSAGDDVQVPKNYEKDSV